MLRARFDVTRMTILERTVCLGYYSRHYTCDHTFYACFFQHAIMALLFCIECLLFHVLYHSTMREDNISKSPSNYVFISISCSWGVLFSNCINYKLKNCYTFTVLKTIQIQFFWNNQTDGSGVHLVIASSCVHWLKEQMLSYTEVIHVDHKNLFIIYLFLMSKLFNQILNLLLLFNKPEFK